MTNFILPNNVSSMNYALKSVPDSPDVTLVNNGYKIHMSFITAKHSDKWVWYTLDKNAHRVQSWLLG